MGYHVFAGCLLIGEGAKTLRSVPGVEIVELNVTDEESISAAAKTIAESLGTKEFWAIVNNAGIPQMGEMEWCPMETLLKVFDVNTFGIVRVTKRFLPLVKKSKGRIVNISSASANRRIPTVVGYSMSKAASKSFSSGIRLEMRKWGIQVIDISPFVYSTSMADENRVTKLLEDSWSKTDPEITSSLGIEYFKKYETFCLRYLNLYRIPRTEEVTECMVDAVTSVSPKILYEPGGILNTISDIVEYLPSPLQDFIQSLFLPIPCFTNSKH